MQTIRKINFYASKLFLNSHRSCCCVYEISKLFPGIEAATSSNETSGKQIYEKMITSGIVASQSQGLFTLLPIGLRSMNKLVSLVEKQMKRIGAQQILLPHLVASSLWKKSKRYETCGSEIMKIKDRFNCEYILSPTHEEAITDIVRNFNLGQNSLPLRLFQMSTKFRDEPNPKHGMLRGREFLMKDLYTFDKCKETALVTYEEVSQAYKDIFKQLKLPCCIAKAEVGTIGGSISHEYHVLSDNGEDSLLLCEKCDTFMNSECASNNENLACKICNGPLILKKGIEVGHTFYLGTRYSEPLLAKFKSEFKGGSFFDMGCYGIGISRLLVTALEYHSSKDNDFLRWPLSIAPYKVCLIAAKRGSKIFDASLTWCNYFYNVLNDLPGYNNEVLVDDRVKTTIGKRFIDIKKLGIPITIIFGRTCSDSVPKFELIDNFNDKKYEFTHLELLQFLSTYNFQ